MKLLLVYLSLILISVSLFSQNYFISEQDALKAFPKKDVYKTKSGWIISKVDTLHFGHGSLPDKSFSFIKAQINGRTMSLPGSYSGRIAEIANFYILGNKQSGYYVSARIKTGDPFRFNIDLENAIAAGEIEPPEEFKTRTTSN